MEVNVINSVSEIKMKEVGRYCKPRGPEYFVRDQQFIS